MEAAWCVQTYEMPLYSINLGGWLQDIAKQWGGLLLVKDILWSPRCYLLGPALPCSDILDSPQTEAQLVLVEHPDCTGCRSCQAFPSKGCSAEYI